MKKKLFCVSALVLSLCISQATMACSVHEERFSGERLTRIIEHLNLTADQTVKIRNIRQKAKQELRPNLEMLHSLHHQTNELLTAATLDNRKLDRVINQEKNVVGSMLKIRAMERHNISNVLTTQQKAKFAEMIHQWEKKNN